MKNTVEAIGKRELRELLSKNWMTHDAMWMKTCVEKVGIEKANEINKAACLSMGMIEIRRIAELFGMDKKDTFEDVKAILEAGLDIIKPDFMAFSVSFPERGVFRWTWKENQCFAFKGMKQMGLIDEYQCGIFERVKGWLKGLGVPFEMEPSVDRCMMNTEGRCERNFNILLP